MATACLLATSLASPAPAGAEVVDHLEAVKAAPLYDIAEGEDFLTNVARYGRFFVTVMLGTANVMLAPLGRAFKNPLSAILAVGSLAGTFYLGNVVLKAMLGIEPPEEIGQFNF